MKQGQITERIICSYYNVYNKLGYGFLEKIYENALAIELAASGLPVQQQAPIKVSYAGQIVGEYFADLLVAEAVIVEVKAAQHLSAAHEAQLLNYLKATGIEVGLLMNFGPQAEVKRKVLDR
jgi:GxxExxY protein